MGRQRSSSLPYFLALTSSPRASARRIRKGSVARSSSSWERRGAVQCVTAATKGSFLPVGRAAGAGQIVLAPWDMGLAGAGGYFWLRELFLALVADPWVVFPPPCRARPQDPTEAPVSFPGCPAHGAPPGRCGAGVRSGPGEHRECRVEMSPLPPSPLPHQLLNMGLPSPNPSPSRLR